MGKVKKLILLCGVLALVGCGKSQEEIRLEEQATQKALEEQKLKEEKLAKEKEAQKMVKDLSFDPDTVKFRNMNGSCGEINSKNKFGGYVGYTRFMVSNFGEDNERQAFIAGMSVSDNPELDKIVNLNFEQKWLIECENFKVSKDADLAQCIKDSETAYLISSLYVENDKRTPAHLKVFKKVLTKDKDEKEKKYTINIIDELIDMDKNGNIQMSANPSKFPTSYAIDKYKVCLSK